jgi:uncharacterized lipoprotein YbaY
VVASTTERDLSGLPVKFSIDLDGVTIDPATTYTIQATIIDGENAWATGRGVPVLTKGNPSSNIAITLDYRPDLIKGAVSGQITGTDVQVGANGYAMAVLLDPATGDSLGNDVRSITAGLPVPFSIGFTVTDVVPTDAYVVTAEVGDGTSTWRNAGGVPVITNGNPKAGVQVPVTAVSVASPSPAPTASPSPSPTPTPASPPGIGTSGNLMLWIILVALVGAAAAFLVARNREQAASAETTEAAVPSDGEVPPGAGADAIAGAAAGEAEPAPPGELGDPATEPVATGDTAPADPTVVEPATPDIPPDAPPDDAPATGGPTPS